MGINLEGLSAKELQALIAEADKRRKALAKRKPAATVRKKIVSLARAEGYTVEELFGTARLVRAKAGVKAAGKPARKSARKSAQKGRKVPPKYRHPGDASKTWAGRGMPPRWLSAELAKGKKLEDFLIK
ncbi:H-NS family nucleoid-associated regulatory protein [Arenimonas fontis]|uniref:H-NS histone family protein n=1 Tax=Arenimonas fontis TaxID=2608255 RepID=A0A5B2ZDQ2_9GAMM|nr:H-NS histone family protein [Arenimonas fontis]KAA2285340.1 H-NS histone family protein [Arenimonas fontis]